MNGGSGGPDDYGPEDDPMERFRDRDEEHGETFYEASFNFSPLVL